MANPAIAMPDGSTRPAGPARRGDDLPRAGRARLPARPARSSTASPTPSGSSSARTGTSPACTATRASPRTGCGSRRPRWCSASASRWRCGPTAARPTTSPRRTPTAAPWPAPTATCRGARATPTRSAPSSTSRTSPGPSSGTPAGWARRPSRTRSTREYWVYDIGENGDCSVDALISDNVRDLVALFRRLPNAKASFATKFVNRDLLGYDPRGKTRIRFSLMPQRVARVVDVRTSPVAERIAAIDDFVAAGYEVHLNFSPVIYYEGWLEDYAALFEQVDDALSEAAKVAAGGGGDLPDAQRPAARGQPRLAPAGRGAALGAAPPGGEGLRDRGPQRAATGGG